MSETKSDARREIHDLEKNVEWLKAHYQHSEYVVIEERSKNIILTAQRDQLLTDNKRVKAQHAACLAANQRLTEQNERQIKTISGQDVCINAKADEITRLKKITVELAERVDPFAYLNQKVTLAQRQAHERLLAEKDVALANANTKINFLRNEVAKLEEQAQLRSVNAKFLGSFFQPHPGMDYTFKPRTITMDVLHPELITLTF